MISFGTNSKIGTLVFFSAIFEGDFNCWVDCESNEFTFDDPYDTQRTSETLAWISHITFPILIFLHWIFCESCEAKNMAPFLNSCLDYPNTFGYGRVGYGLYMVAFSVFWIFASTQCQCMFSIHLKCTYVRAWYIAVNCVIKIDYQYLFTMDD